MQNNGLSVAVFFVLVFFWIFFHTVSEKHIHESTEHLVAESELLLDIEEFEMYKASCKDNNIVFTTQAYSPNWNYYDQQNKKISDILVLCRAAYGYANMACWEVEWHYQNKYKQKQLLSMMNQRIENFWNWIGNQNTYFSDLWQLVKDDLASVTQLNPLKDQKNHGQWTLKDCYELDTALESIHNNWDRYTQIWTATIDYNVNLKRYDNIMYFDLPQRKDYEEELSYTLVQPWYNHWLFKIFAKEVIQPNDIQRYIQYEAVKNTDNNREQYKQRLHANNYSVANQSQQNTPILPSIPDAPILDTGNTTPIWTIPEKEPWEVIPPKKTIPNDPIEPILKRLETQPKPPSKEKKPSLDTPTNTNPYLQHTNTTSKTYNPY